MFEPKSAQQILHFSQIGTSLSGLARQMEILRFWSDELVKPRYNEKKRLLRYGFKVYSQSDEDGIIQEIFNRIGMTNRIFIEFGVETGHECNTAKLLLENWRGLWIESSAPCILKIRRTLRAFLDDGRLRLKKNLVTAENINILLNEADLSGEVDFLSIDIDYNDYWVWKAIQVINPRVVAIEYNATLRPPLSLVVPYEPTRKWDGTNYFGASLEALVRLGRSKGYCIVGCNFAGVNAFFVRDDLYSDRFWGPATADEHYEPPRYFFIALRAGHRPQLGYYVPV